MSGAAIQTRYPVARLHPNTPLQTTKNGSLSRLFGMSLR